MNKTQSRKPIWTLPWLAEGIAVSGALIFSIQLWIYAHTQLSILDEGAYLLKGYLFVTREYWPFQDYGPWTNHMPLSFLIPGWVQALFGPGLRTGRYFAVGLGIVMLLGVWIIARRMGGRWWAAAAVWLFAFSVPIIKIYSIWASQGLIACMLVWVLVLCLGRDRPLWQLLLGTGLAGLILLTRLNMAPVLPILLAYIFWENGKKIGLWNLAVGALVIIVGHAFFWPGILKLWTKWLPAGLTPYLDAWRSPVGATPNWNPDVDLHGRLKSFLQGLRYHFFALVGTLFTWLRWPQKNKWYSEWRFRASVFLSVLFGVLFALHLWASLGKDYCVFCFRAYLSFFIILGLLLVITSFSSWRPVVKSARRWFSVLAMTALSLGMAYSASLVWGNMLITNRFVRKLLTLQVPRVDGFSLLPGNIPLWGLLSNKFGWAEEEIFYTTTVLLRRLTPALLVLLFGGLLFFFAVKRIRLIQKIPSDSARSLSTNTILIYIALGTLLSFGIGL
ncbi:MAG: glycosyltransferase family 39 protein, partial [Chloroflexota bacterium]|nr:glycosyltransferase family 39 protein [Chloroflexota bacterium]